MGLVPIDLFKAPSHRCLNLSNLNGEQARMSLGTAEEVRLSQASWSLLQQCARGVVLGRHDGRTWRGLKARGFCDASGHITLAGWQALFARGGVWRERMTGAHRKFGVPAAVAELLTAEDLSSFTSTRVTLGMLSGPGKHAYRCVSSDSVLRKWERIDRVSSTEPVTILGARSDA